MKEGDSYHRQCFTFWRISRRDRCLALLTFFKGPNYSVAIRMLFCYLSLSIATKWESFVLVVFFHSSLHTCALVLQSNQHSSFLSALICFQKLTHIRKVMQGLEQTPSFTSLFPGSPSLLFSPRLCLPLAQSTSIQICKMVIIHHHGTQMLCGNT